MKSDLAQNGVAVLLAIIGVAVVAVILSTKSDTVNVLNAGGNSFANAIRCALGPIIGGSSCQRTPITNVTSTITFGGLG